jgi:hypothetical protein
MRHPLCLSALILLLTGTPVPAQDNARAILERAIKAHGGQERLTQVRADRAKLKGTLLLGDKRVPFTGEILVQLPGQMKTMVAFNVGERDHTLIQIVNGERAWTTLDGQPQKVEGAALAESQGALALARAVRLVPLLTDKSYQLTGLADIKVNGRPAAGVKVTAKGRKDIRLYFDKETGLLVKSEHNLDDAAGKEVLQEEFYSDFRDLGGFKRPVKMTAQRKGVTIVEAELLEAKYYDGFPEAEFAKP